MIRKLRKNEFFPCRIEFILKIVKVDSNLTNLCVFIQKRDLDRIWQKLRIVVNPFRKDQGGPDEANKRKEIRNWDLWGPFFFCLMLASILSATTNADDKTLLFEIVFVIVWLGAAVIAVNG